jgi:hypothetical protein
VSSLRLLLAVRMGAAPSARPRARPQGLLQNPNPKFADGPLHVLAVFHACTFKAALRSVSCHTGGSHNSSSMWPC